MLQTTKTVKTSYFCKGYSRPYSQIDAANSVQRHDQIIVLIGSSGTMPLKRCQCKQDTIEALKESQVLYPREQTFTIPVRHSCKAYLYVHTTMSFPCIQVESTAQYKTRARMYLLDEGIFFKLSCVDLHPRTDYTVTFHTQTAQTFSMHRPHDHFQYTDCTAIFLTQIAQIFSHPVINTIRRKCQ